ncbi:MAG: hypothetical protein SF028_02415 [Candidatus Sumerlaeia bacterium]|nr:hypothetical protein [Candidatus Sumerlaeia bacterium]
MTESGPRRDALALLALALLAWLQTAVFVERSTIEPSFLFGTDTVAHDAVAHLWIRGWLERDPGTVPLWMAPLQGGLPTLGAFLWTPFAPPLWPHYALEYPAAQRGAWLLALWIAGCGGYAAARALALRRGPALFAAAAWMLCGHAVTLIHAGHLQKVMALSWVGFAAAGFWRAGASSGARAARGAALAGAALGMMFLSGHPQIAYGSAAAGLALLAARAGRRLPRRLAHGAAAVLLGALAGAPQLLPGLEMAALSNRAAGVGFEEAVATSYPPRELLEFAAPRFLGSNTPADAGAYHGAWGERIVSDYSGGVVLALAFAALAARGARRRPVRALAALAALSILVGLGSHTPFYRILYDHLPGFAGFRSPATFFFVAAFAAAMLAGFGAQAALRGGARARIATAAGALAVALLYGAALRGAAAIPGWSWSDPVRGLALPLAAALLLALPGRALTARLALAGALAALDLMGANRAFLREEPWERFAAFLAPTPAEAAIAAAYSEPRRVWYPGRELSLRPVLSGIDALNGYHPLRFAWKDADDAALGLGSPAWRARWGVLGAIPAPPEGRFEPETPVRVLLPDGTEAAPRSARLAQRANSARLELEADAAGEARWAANTPPGWTLRVDGQLVGSVKHGLWRASPAPAGRSVAEWRYEPASYRTGLFLGAAGFGLALFAAGATRRVRAPRPR